MPITFDGVTITVVGGTENSPYTFEDIYQADVSNGWGVVSKQGDNQYEFRCKLQIGDGTNETWLIDANKAISHTIDDNFISILANGHFRCGTVIDETDRTTKDGCFIYTNSSDKYIIEFANGGILELYSTTISAESSTKIQSTYGESGHRIWNCNIIHTQVNVTGDPPDVDFYRTNWQSSQIGPAFTTTNASDILISDCTYGTIWFFISSPVTIKNYRMIGETYSFFCYCLDADLYAINVECKWKFFWNSTNSGKIYRQYTFNLKVIDKVGNPISNAKVRMHDKDGNLVFEETTDANGQIPEQIITRGYYDQDHGSELVDFAPLTLEIVKEGLKPYRKSFIPEKAIDWTIKLEHEDISIDEEVLL